MAEGEKPARAGSEFHGERPAPDDIFFNLIENAPFGVYLVDSRFRLAQASAGTQQMFSNIRPLIGRDFAEVLRLIWAPPFAEKAIELFRHTLATGEPHHLPDASARRADTGAVETYDWRIGRVTLPGGEYGVVCYFYDMTPQRQTERALRKSEERYRAVVESQTEMVCRFEPGGKILFANAAYAHAFGADAETLEGANFWDIVADADREAVRAMLTQLTPDRPDIRIENRIKGADGVRWTQWTNRAIRFDKAGRVAEAQSAGLDITDRKRAEERLRESEERFRTMADHAPVLIWVTEADGSCSFLSQSWYDFTGQTPETALGSGWLDAVHEEDRAHTERILLEANSEQQPFKLDYRLRAADGEFRWAIGAGRPRLGADGQWLGFIGSTIDNHEHRQADEQRELLLAELNHRVKNTLTVVQAIAHQTFAKEGDPLLMRKAFEGRLMALASAHDLLTRSNWERTPLSEIADGARRACGIAPERFRIEGETVSLDPKQALSLALALHELCTNAVKHGALSNGDGAVEIKWRVDEPPASRLRLEWKERGGPPVAAPPSRGFGLTMIDRALAHDIEGEVKMTFAREGVTCIIEAPLAAQSSVG